MRPPLPLVAATALVAVAVVAVLTTQGGGEGTSSPGTTLDRVAATAIPAVRWRVVGDELHGPGGVEALPPETRGEVLAALERYVQLGSLTPMRRGGIGRGLEAVFARDAFARAAGQDRAALFDEGAPVDPDTVPVRAEAALVGLLDPHAGAPAVVVARFVVQLSQGPGGVEVLRSGELTLIPGGGTWVIDGYSVDVNRARLPAAAPGPEPTG